MNKEEIISTVNAIKNTPIAPQKDKLIENSSGTKFNALAQYNAMLDNITIGAHTNITIKKYGIDWTMRLLTAEEEIHIKTFANKECKKHEIFDDFYHNFQIVVKTLAQVLTPSPFKTEGKAIFNEEDLKLIPYEILLDLYKEWCYFSDMATARPTDLTNEEMENIYNIAKKKPEVLKELERAKLLPTMSYILNYCNQLEKMLKSDLNNTNS